MLWTLSVLFFYFFFFNDTATTEIYTLSLHDALPICVTDEEPEVINLPRSRLSVARWIRHLSSRSLRVQVRVESYERSEEHTSELQSQFHLVCRLLLEKKKKITHNVYTFILFSYLALT